MPSRWPQPVGPTTPPPDRQTAGPRLALLDLATPAEELVIDPAPAPRCGTADRRRDAGGWRRGGAGHMAGCGARAPTWEQPLSQEMIDALLQQAGGSAPAPAGATDEADGDDAPAHLRTQAGLFAAA